MMRRFSFLLLLLAPAFAHAQDPAMHPGFDAAKLKSITELLDKAVADGDIHGAVALVHRDGKLALAAVTSRPEQPLKRDSIFRIASMTKPITSVAAMILVDDGKLKLDDPISKYIPEFKDIRVYAASKEGEKDPTVPAERPITVHHLLTHTSGLVYRLAAPKPLAEKFVAAGIHDGISTYDGKLGDNVKKIASLPLWFQPGTAWHYGLNTDVLGRVVEVASGMEIDAFMKQRIFDPLGMKDTSFYPPEDKIARMAPVYSLGGDKKIAELKEGNITVGNLVWSGSFHLKGPRTYFSPGGGLVSTADDYSRFMQMMLNGGTLDGKKILSPESVKKMTTNQIGDIAKNPGVHGNQFGYGFGIVSEKSKDAATPGSYTWGGFYHTYFWVDPEKRITAVLMTQLYPNDHLKFREKFKESVYAAVK